MKDIIIIYLFCTGVAGYPPPFIADVWEIWGKFWKKKVVPRRGGKCVTGGCLWLIIDPFFFQHSDCHPPAGETMKASFLSEFESEKGENKLLFFNYIILH